MTEHFLTLSAPGYFCLIMPWGPPSPPLPCVNLDRKMLLTWNLAVIPCYVTKKMIEKIFKIAAIGMMTSLIMSIFLEKLFEKCYFDVSMYWCKYVLMKCFFLKLTLGQLEKRFSKVKLTYKLNMHRLIC